MKIIWKRLNSSLGRNIISLYAIQFANYILPFITIPYLVRVLGPEKFGAVAFCQSLMAYFILIVNYGFNWSVTRKISVHRDDWEAVSKTATNVWAAKGFLCGISLLVLISLTELIPKFGQVSTLLFILYGTVVGNVLFPTWLFQGLERLVPASMINFLIRILTTVGIFVLIRKPSDYIFYAGLLTFQWLGAGIVAVVFAYRTLPLQLVLPTLKEIWQELAEGWMLFLSMGAVSLYTVGNAFILGVLTNNTIVGYYSAAEKLVRAAQGLLTPITQAIYPRFSKMASESINSSLYWARRGLMVQGSLGFFLSIILLVGSEIIVRGILGPNYESSIQILQILSPLPLLIGIGSSFGQLILLPFHKDKARLLVLLAAGTLNLILAVILTPVWSANGMALSVLISEIFVTSTFFIYLKATKLSPI